MCLWCVLWWLNRLLLIVSCEKGNEIVVYVPEKDVERASIIHHLPHCSSVAMACANLVPEAHKLFRI